jgi:hypothetical protein
MSKMIIRSAREMLEAEAKINEQKRIAESKSFILINPTAKPSNNTKTNIKSYKKTFYKFANAIATFAVILGGSGIMLLSSTIRTSASTLDLSSISTVVGKPLPWGTSGVTSTISLVSQATNSSNNELCDDFGVSKVVGSSNRIGFGVPNQSKAGMGNQYLMTFDKPVVDFSFYIESTPQTQSKTPSQILEGLKLNMITEAGEIYNITNSELGDQVNVDVANNTFVKIGKSNEFLAFSYTAKKGVSIKSMSIETFDTSFQTLDQKTQTCGLLANEGIIFQGIEANLPPVITSENNITTIKSEDKEGQSIVKFSAPVNSVPINPALYTKPLVIGPGRSDPGINFFVYVVGTLTDTDGNGFASIGETVTFKVYVTNNGTRALLSYPIEDDFGKCPSIVGDKPPLPSGEIAVETCTYTVTQADIDAGQVSNSATVPYSDGDLNSIRISNLAIVALPSKVLKPDFKVEKLATWNDENKDGYPQVGETIKYSFPVTNTGDAVLSAITITDNKCSPVVNTLIAKLNVAEVNSAAYCIYSITAGDIATGFTVNTVEAKSNDPINGVITRNADNKITFPVRVYKPDFKVNKLATWNDENKDGYPQVGETVKYSFVVTNTGDVAINAITITDSKCSPVVSPLIGTLNVAEVNSSAYCVYSITEDDIKNSFTVNTVEAKSNDPKYGVITRTADNKITYPIKVYKPDFKVDKLAVRDYENPNSIPKVGDIIKYSFVVTNTGDVAINAITITDSKCSPVVSPLIGTLNVAEVNNNAYCLYYITADDIKTGFVLNTVEAKSNDPKYGVITRTDDNKIVFPERIYKPDFKLEKFSTWNDESKDGFPQVGETIKYTFPVTNTGDIAINAITIIDNKCKPVINPLIITLTVGEVNKSAYCIYSITADDIKNGFTVNTVEAKSNDPKYGVITRNADNKIVYPVMPTKLPEPIVIQPVLIKATVRTGGNLAFSYMLFTTGLIGLLLLRINKNSFES